MAHIRYTGKAVINGSPIKKLPVIVSGALKVNLLALEYLLYLRVSCSETTLNTYARHLVDFFSQLEADNEDVEEGDGNYIDWDEIDDCWLEGYSRELILRHESDEENSKNYCSQVLRTVVAYLYWAQSRGYTNQLIGSNDDCRIQLVLGDGRNEGKIAHPLVKKLARQKAPSRTAPRREWIETIKAYSTVKSRDLRVRFELMLDWTVELGLRAHEVCALTVSQLPLRETAEKAYINGHNVAIVITVSKGSMPKTVPLPAALVIRTRDYIDEERSRVLQGFRREARKQREAFTESGVIFVSSTTAGGLNPISFSNQVRSAWLNAVNHGALTVDEVVWAHGCRHRFTTDKLKAHDKRGIKNPERRVKHLTRHKYESSMEVYSVGRFSEDFDE